MPSGLIALLDDVATLTKLAASSLDDIGAAVGKAGSKAAGVVIDDTAVTPRYVTGLSPERELPIIGKIAVGSLKNKLLIILPVALFLSWLGTRIGIDLITPLLMIGGAYLCFEGAEKLWEKVAGDHHAAEELLTCDNPAELEQRQVAGAIRTDFILSAEIMVIALASMELSAFWLEAVVLAVVGIVITVLVYGTVALIVKLDDIGLHLAARGGPGAALGRGLVLGVPKLLALLSVVGTAAMLWVGGQILLHGLEVLHIGEALPHLTHDLAASGAAAIGFWQGFWNWTLNALFGAIVGIIVGAVIVAVLHLLPKRKAAASEAAAH
jgi:predicted DNA repair protein MutK